MFTLGTGGVGITVSISISRSWGGRGGVGTGGCAGGGAAVVAESGDAGVPAVLNAPDTPQAEAFQALARSLAARISVLQYRSQE